MVKTVVVTLATDIPDTALSTDATVTVNGATYNGKVTGIITHEPASEVPPTQSITIKGAGLAVA